MSVSTTGNWKQIPKPKIRVMMRERYSDTFGINSMVAAPSELVVAASPIENLIRIGMATK